MHHHDEHHGIIEEIAHVERLAEPHRGAGPAELYRRLAVEHGLLGGGEQVVEVGEEPVELKGVRIPVGQQGHLYHHAHESGEPAGEGLVQEDQHEGQAHDAQTFQQHGARMVHPGIEQEDQQSGQRVVYQTDGLYRKQVSATLYTFE